MLTFYFFDFRPFMNIKYNANFSILGTKNAKKQPEYFVHQYKFFGLQLSWFSRASFHEKAKKKFTACSI